MKNTINLISLYEALSSRSKFSDLKPENLNLLTTKGLVHDHVRISSYAKDRPPMLIRVPRLSQFSLDPIANLKYQAACFSLASLSKYTPRLIDSLSPSKLLPMGALIVEEIKGKHVKLPENLDNIAKCFAQVHSLKVPKKEERGPIIYHKDPISGVIDIINMQAKFINSTTENLEVRQLLNEELNWARKFASRYANQHPPPRLCLTDTHPGNFMIDDYGKAYFVDLEKALYGSPGIDLGHATILTSTLWDIEVQATLSKSEIVAFYAAYLSYLPLKLTSEIRPWLLPMRRLAWLRSVTWSCKWFVQQHKKIKIEDGFRSKIQSHLTRRLSAFVDLETIHMVRSEWTGSNKLVLD